MPLTTEQRIAGAQQRLQHSRMQIFALAHELKGDRPPPLPDTSNDFPHSRLLRALIGERGRMLLGAAALGCTLLRPRMIWRLLR
ncbi:MAG: hypothetical protein ACREU2_18010, partial [Steroidobacteraceae bacterium]